MRRITQILLFFFIFSIDIKVKAGEQETLHAPMNIVQSPERCLWSHLSCAIRVTEKHYQIVLSANSHVTLDNKSTIIRVSKKHLKFLEGTLWVKSADWVTIETEFGNLKGRGEFWLERDSDRVTASVIKGEFSMIPQGLKEEISIVPGQMNWISGVGMNGHATSGIPMQIDYNRHLKRWFRLFDGEKREWEHQAREFYIQWKKSVKEVSQYQELLARRHIANENEQQQKRSRYRKKIREQEKEMRELFRQKTLQTPSSL